MNNEINSRNIFVIRTLIANLAFVELDNGWVLVDAGIPFSGPYILKAAKRKFGEHTAPLAIVLTHGHFDHVGALDFLLSKWNVPVYAHDNELPFLTGKKDYLPPDPTVGGGLLAAISPLYPRRAINLGSKVVALPQNGEIPFMPGWRWIFTPGHTAGHVSLFRDEDRALIAGDVFITVKQESALAVLAQTLEIHGPPAYFTPDWMMAKQSVERITALEPDWAVTGHGKSIGGDFLLNSLKKLLTDFETTEIPHNGKYVH
ncbi:MAG TPA: MBL fold metallo-hydrolase [Bacillus bacterium]|nr:MBL fold metallo-hydrolase [Bacillus sp. (in: firmicutes)]